MACLLTACVAISVQHHILAQLFLVSFDPKIPRLGAQRKEAAKKTNVSYGAPQQILVAENQMFSAL